MSEEEWTEWFLHDGKGCPCVGMYVQVELKSAGVREGIVPHAPGASEWTLKTCSPWLWETLDPRFDGYQVIRYRIRKPRALQQLREIAANVKEGVDA